MSSRNRLVAGLAMGLAVSVAWACGPFFPIPLLDDREGTLTAMQGNSFDWEAAHLVPTPADGLKALEPDRADQSDQDRSAQRQKYEEELPQDQVDGVTALRDAKTGEAALKLKSDLPPALRLYTAAAIDYRTGSKAAAAKGFAAVLALPEADAKPRAVWAAYMIGRIEETGEDIAPAEQAFAQARALAVAGAPDPLGLAVASYGEEARLHLDHANSLLAKGHLPDAKAADFTRETAAAVRLYAEGAARGSTIAIDSLRMVADQLEDDANALTAAAADPLVLRMMVAYEVALPDTAPADTDQAPDAQASAKPPSDAAPPESADAMFQILADAAVRDQLPPDAGLDRLAVLAYQGGRYEGAARLADSAAGPLAAWVKAKLALQKGDLDGAARLYAAAVTAFPPSAATAALEPEQAGRMEAESGVLALGRGEYVDALARLFEAGDYWGDAAYVAERVLTVDELKRFVDAHVPAPPPAPPPPPAADGTTAEAPAEAPASRLRDLLARRLVRAGRIAEALGYFYEPETRQHATDYMARLDRAQHAAGSTEQARAWFEAALLARDSGLEMMGTEEAPDFAFLDGEYDGGYGPSEVKGKLVTAGELERDRASAVKPDTRYHYRYVAVDEARAAADLLPPRSQAYAAVLCRATSWMEENGGSRPEVETLYRRYVKVGALVPWAKHFGRDCPDPDFAAAGHFERTRVLHEVRRFGRSRRAWLAAGLLAMAVAVGLFLLWRRRRAARPG